MARAHAKPLYTIFVLAATLAFVLLAGASPVKVAGPDQVPGATEPQAAVDENGAIYVAFATPGKLYISRSTNRGQSFEPPVAAADVPGLQLGKRRGPRISVNNGNISVTAIADGKLLSWCWASGDTIWSTPPAQVNDDSASAEEGLHGMATNGSELAVVWIANKGSDLYVATSQDGGQNWSPNNLVYKSPGGAVCNCCEPSVGIAGDGTMHVMFRNLLNGNRDMYMCDSTDDGTTWSTPKIIGSGHWKLDACPMDGGSLGVDDEGNVLTIWRREDAVFKDKINYPEAKIGVGLQPWIYPRQGTYTVYLKKRPGPLMMFKGGDDPRPIAQDADDPMVAGPIKGDGPVVAVWVDSKGEIMSQVLN